MMLIKGKLAYVCLLYLKIFWCRNVNYEAICLKKQKHSEEGREIMDE